MKSKLFVPSKGIPIEFGESKIITLNNGLIYKKFKDNISLATRRMKKRRLEYLSDFDSLKKYYPEIEYFVEPLMRFYIKGYVMKDVQYKSLDICTLNSEQKLEVLHKIREVLGMFERIGLRYYDIHTGNVVISQNGLPMFFDIDSILYADETKPDINPYGLDYYTINGGKLNFNFQLVKLNLFVKRVLEICQDLVYDEIGAKIMEDVYNPFSPKSIYAHENLLDHVSLKK